MECIKATTILTRAATAPVTNRLALAKVEILKDTLLNRGSIIDVPSLSYVDDLTVRYPSSL